MGEEFGDLRLFTQIVAAGSLSAAARRLNTSLPAVSRRLSGLEDRLGVRLIDRGSRKFTLTEEGLHLQRRGLPILEALDTVSAELDGLAGLVRGYIKVSAPTEIGRRRIAGLCRQFTARYPDVCIDLGFTDARPDILEDDLDVVLQTKRPTSSDVILRRLLSSRRVICAAPAYIERMGRPERPEDLFDHDCIRMKRRHTLYDRWIVQSGGERKEITVKGRLICDSTDTIHDWAVAGAGIAMKALWDIEDDLEAGRLVELLPDYAGDDIHLYMTYFNRRYVSPRLRHFIDFIVDGLS